MTFYLTFIPQRKLTETAQISDLTLSDTSARAAHLFPRSDSHETHCFQFFFFFWFFLNYNYYLEYI